ncbi:MAG: response regulator [Deltaproteobacteria bacterium]|nr:response regulator [Deltaproteobacteria bacterium]
MAKLTILIAEDDKRMQMVYDTGLPSAVFEKHFAENGKEALEIYNSLHPDIIVLDILMPVMSGYDALRKIREELEDTSTAIIMATSKAGEEDVMACIRHGIQGYVLKPFKWTEIADRILKYYGKVSPENARIAVELQGLPGGEE